MNKPLAIASLKRGLIAGAVAVLGGLAWQGLVSDSGINILPFLAGVGVTVAATMISYFEGRQR